MNLQRNRLFKDGKWHRHWSLVKSRRVAGSVYERCPTSSPDYSSNWRRPVVMFDYDVNNIELIDCGDLEPIA